MAILVTGGAGYIGSHIVVELLNAGYDVVIVDNLVNSYINVLDRIKQITNKDFVFYETDICDEIELNRVFKNNDIEACIHLAGLKSVGDSMDDPLSYYHNNVGGTMNLLKLMQKHNVKNIVFSSSASIYGEPLYVPIIEKHPVGNCVSPYGRTKYIIEQMLMDLYESDPEWSIISLRYFNPIGAHKSGLIGDCPKGKTSNLMPNITKAAIGDLDFIHVYGYNYNTPDGTCIRDYIHVVDLALGHVKAIEKLRDVKSYLVYNLGTGYGYSVLDVINIFENTNGVKVSYILDNQRNGDVSVCYADASLAFNELDWKPQYGLMTMCEDAWRWQKNNPHGYNE